jgi:hypothetical protein
VGDELRDAVETRILDRLALDDALLAELAGPSSLPSEEISRLRRSAATRRAFRRYPLLEAAARTAFRVVRSLRGGPR